MLIQISLIVTKSDRVVIDVTKLLLLERIVVKGKKLFKTRDPNNVKLILIAKGEFSVLDSIHEILQNDKHVISVIDISVLDNLSISENKGVKKEKNSSSLDSVKIECAKILISFFGESGADELDTISHEEAIQYSRGKVAGLIGEEAAKVFDKIGN